MYGLFLDDGESRVFEEQRAAAGVFKVDGDFGVAAFALEGDDGAGAEEVVTDGVARV